MRRGLFGRLGKLGLNHAIQSNISPQPVYLTQWKIVGNSEVHTLPYPDGVVLPTGYKRCKYLTFDGNSYINTEINLSNDIGLSLDLSTTTNSKTIIGARDSNARGVVFGYIWGSDSIYRVNYAYGAVTTNYLIQTNINNGLIHHIILDGQQAKIDNESVEINRGDIFPQQPIFIGTWNTDGTADNRMFIGKIYSVILYDSNGNLFNGIPCLDNNDVPCLYDTVSGTSFYNDGTGTFGYEIEPQPTEIWSCGEYNAIDGKYHILVQPQGGSIADIALTEPLRKVNDVADTIEFPSDTEGKALVTRNFTEISLSAQTWRKSGTITTDVCRWFCNPAGCYIYDVSVIADILCSGYDVKTANQTNAKQTGISMNNLRLTIYDPDYNNENDNKAFVASLNGKVCIYRLATPTTELADAPQIEEAESYSCVISQGGKAVSWSSFETE